MNIPDSVLTNLFNPTIDKSLGFNQKIKAYSSLDGKFIYIYLYGGNGAYNYFTKLIFSQETYITKRVANYYSLSSYGCISEKFKV